MTTENELKRDYSKLIEKIERKARGEVDVESTVVNEPGKGVVSLDETVRDPDGLQVQRRENRNTYYPTGEVDVISQKWFDADDKLFRHREIKHYTDGRQPTVTTIK